MLINAHALYIPLANKSVNCIVTSPPYWGLRAYGTDLQVWQNGHEPCKEHEWITKEYYTEKTAAVQSKDAFSEPGEANIKRLKEGRWRKDDTCSRCGAWRGELGLEPIPELYVDHLVQIFREVWRVLRDDGTLWLNLGDSYSGSGKGAANYPESAGAKQLSNFGSLTPKGNPGVVPVGLKPKDLIGVPWRVAFALQADGWYLRSEIIWHKPNPMPESVTDRPTKSHEQIFLLSKSPRYYYDADAVREPQTTEPHFRDKYGEGYQADYAKGDRFSKGGHIWGTPLGRNRRSVWTVNTYPYEGAHYATFPTELVTPCVLAGCPQGGIVLDPFCGSGTVGEVCRETLRQFVGLDISLKYLEENALPRAERKTALETLKSLPMFSNLV